MIRDCVPGFLAENRLTLLDESVSPRIWLGAPNSIKGPTEAVFHRQSGNNMLIVGQRDEAALAILSIGLVSLAAQYPRGAAKFILFDGTPTWLAMTTTSSRTGPGGAGL